MNTQDLLNYYLTEMDKEFARKSKTGKGLHNPSIYATKKLMYDFVNKNYDKINLEVASINNGVGGEIAIKGTLFNDYSYANNGVDYQDKTGSYEIKTNNYGNHNVDIDINEKVDYLLFWHNDLVYKMDYKEFVNYLLTFKNDKNVKVKNDTITFHAKYDYFKNFKNKKVVLTNKDIF